MQVPGTTLDLANNYVWKYTSTSDEPPLSVQSAEALLVDQLAATSGVQVRLFYNQIVPVIILPI